MKRLALLTVIFLSQQFLFASPALATGHYIRTVFVSEDHRVECAFEKHPLAVLCISQASREEEPKLTEECGSHMSGLILHAHGSARDTEVCNMLVEPRSHPFVLRNGRSIQSGSLVCRDYDGITITCGSLVSHYSFELNYGLALFPAFRRA